MKKITLNTDGTLKQVWLDKVHKSIPDEAIEVNDSIVTELLNNRQTKKYNPETKTISDYIAPLILSSELIRKKQEAEQHAQALIDKTFSNPTQSDVDINLKFHKKLVEARQNDKANRLAGGISLGIDEIDQAKTDQKLSEYEVKCWEAYIKAIAEIDKKSTAAEVVAININNITTWPEWSPPVKVLQQ